MNSSLRLPCGGRKLEQVRFELGGAFWQNEPRSKTQVYSMSSSGVGA
jgi:hypothetical protein